MAAPVRSNTGAQGGTGGSRLPRRVRRAGGSAERGGPRRGDRARFAAILGVLDGPAAGILLHNSDGRVVSAALMAIADGIVITGNVVTDRAERRKGYAAAMMRTGLAWAAANGAHFAALNVAADNPAAQELYAGLGYRRQYEYVYRVPPVRRPA